MDKESIIELQKIDCNCNDCWFMIRDIEKFREHKENSELLAFKSLEKSKKIKLLQASEWAEKGEFEKASALTKEAEKLKVTNYGSQQLIQYGNCHKFNKSVSFIPNTCQLETQHCFQHRRN